MAAPQVSASRPRRLRATCRFIILVAMALLQLAGVANAKCARATRGLQQAVYCVAKPDAEAGKLQEALDWACGEGASLGSVDCKAIQKGGPCFEPDTVAGHASYAFTLYYYQQSAASHACDFKGLATLTYSNPSSGTCVYPTTSQLSSSSSASSPPVVGSLPNAISISPAPSPNGASSCCVLYYAFSSLLCTLIPLLVMLL